MILSKTEIDFLVSEICRELGAKRDGGNKNLICKCPCCNKDSKFGIYIGRETERKKLFMSNCFSCGASTYSLEQLLSLIGREDLIIAPVSDIKKELEETILFPLENKDEIDDSLGIVELPDFYKQCFSNPYLKSRGFVFDDYDYFPVGTAGRLNYRFNDYVIFPILDEGDIVGYVARHTWSKQEIDKHNRIAKKKSDYPILRFRNSTENDFVKLLYNYDSVIPGETEIVIIVEGIFDVIALTRKLDLYDNNRVVIVATFGKKISQAQIYKLQSKGVLTIVIGYDGDAVEATKKITKELTPYFNVFIADIPNPNKDWEDLTEDEIYRVFAYSLKTPIEYSINKIQQ
jgi:DNA primase